MKTQLQFIKDWCKYNQETISDDKLGQILQAKTITEALQPLHNLNSTLAVLALDLVDSIKAGKTEAYKEVVS
jgi:hypothetical protein